MRQWTLLLLLGAAGCAPAGRPSAAEIRALVVAQNPPHRLRADGTPLLEAEQQITVDQVLTVNGSVVVLYDTPSAQGYVIFRRKWLRWYITENAWTADPVRDGVLTYQYDQLQDAGSALEPVIGRVRAPEARGQRYLW